MLHSKRRYTLVWMIILVIGLAVYASVTGPEARYTNAPGDIGNCVQCHDTFHEANVGPGSLRLNGTPPVYEPGQNYTFAVTVQQGGRQRFGFQLTAIDKDGNRAGSLTPLGGDTQSNPDTGLGSRQYIQHTQPGANPTAAGTRTWQIRWTAPATDVGTVRFYVAGNAANGDGTNQNDHIYTTVALSESPTSIVSVTLLTNPAGQTLEAGSQFTINWSATNTSNIDSLELRYSTDDGATFPITHLIRSTTDASVSSHEWTVPNVATSQARIRLQAATTAGSAVEAISGRFTIAASGGAARPQVESALVDGKVLFVTGRGFLMGAVVELNGDDQKTRNMADFEHELKCKKAGKWVPIGVPVSIVVRNPDGQRSDPVPFTRQSQ